MSKFFCLFFSFPNSLLKSKKFFNLGARKSAISRSIRHFWRGFLWVFKNFLSSESYFLKCKIFRASVSWNIRNFVRVSVSRNIRKAFFWENTKNFLILELESSFSRNIRKYYGIVETICRPFFFHLLLNVSQHEFQ